MLEQYGNGNNPTPDTPDGNDNNPDSDNVSQDEQNLGHAETSCEGEVSQTNAAITTLQGAEQQEGTDYQHYQGEQKAVTHDILTGAPQAQTSHDESQLISNEKQVSNDVSRISSDQKTVDNDISKTNSYHTSAQHDEQQLKHDDPKGHHQHGSAYNEAKSHDQSAHQKDIDSKADNSGSQAKQVSGNWQKFNAEDASDNGQHKSDFEKAAGDYAKGKAENHNDDFEALKKAVSGKNATEEVGKKHHAEEVGSPDSTQPGTVNGDLNNFANAEHKLDNDFKNNPTDDKQIANDDAAIANDATALHQDHDHLCFVTGTMIKTVTGEKAVEDLNVGDIAITADGTRKPIAWIGHQDVIFSHKDEKPVCVKANAIADGVPYKALYTSAAHAYAFTATASGLFGKSTKDVLIRASALVNGVSIVSTDMRRATYWHIELEGGHNILVANGAAAESFADHGERSFFTNASSAKAQTVMAVYLPRVKRGRYVRSVRKTLAIRAEELLEKGSNKKKISS